MEEIESLFGALKITPIFHPKCEEHNKKPG